MKEDKGRTPLRIILNNFLNHIEKLESQRSPDDSYEKEFQDLKYFSENLKGQKQYASTEGEKEVNRKKNRYKDILPFDFSRVTLGEYVGTAGSDYINANFIKGASGSPAYIACQGPLPHTVNDFWRMVVECEVHVIIMACNEDEAGKHKCEKYWVDREGEVKQFGMVRIRLIQGSSVCPDFSVRTVKIEYTNKDSSTEERTVCQFHYSAWPDHGVPPSVRPLLDMVRLVRDTQASETLPVLVHCSAGCGRTGTICAIDYVWGLLRAGKLTKDFSLLNLVREMRKQRVAMVQTTEQYILVHRAVRELFREQLRVIDSHPYENIDVDGALLNSKSDEEPVYESICAAEGPGLPSTVSRALDSAPAPPLPRKNRVHLAASKHEKEVENQTEKQRNSQGGAGGIAKLKAMFERSPVARSHSLGRRQASTPSSSAVTDQTGAGQPPALPIKRSKSLRILGSGERSKLSLTTRQDGSASQSKTKPGIVRTKGMAGGLLRRRRSFESNNSPKPMRRSLHLDDEGRRLLQDCKDFLAGSADPSVDSQQRVENVVSGIGMRERRDSFRQAVSKRTDLGQKPKSYSSALQGSRSHEDVDEVDAGPGIRRCLEKDEVDSRSASVIVVKPDRTSPKPELYVKSLPGESSNCKVNRYAENSDNDSLRKISRVWNRSATSVDLKSNLHNSDLSLQELKSCLRREGTAHELKMRKEESGLSVAPVKLYKSLDRVIKKESDGWDPHPLQPVLSERRSALASGNALISPHRSPQTTVDRRNPVNAPISPHRSPQSTVDRMNPIICTSNPFMMSQTSAEKRNPLSPHHSPHATVDRRNPLTSSSSPHHSPQTTVDRRNPLSPHHSPQTTVDRRHPFTTPSSPQHSPQTTVDRRNPPTASSSPHQSPQTTVDRRNPPPAATSPHQSPQTTVDRRNPLPPRTSPQSSPQATVDRRNPYPTPPSPHRSPQTTVDRRNPFNPHSSPHQSPQSTLKGVNTQSSLPSHHRVSEQAMERRNQLGSPQLSPQATVDRSSHNAPIATSNSSHRASQPMVDRRTAPMAMQVPPMPLLVGSNSVKTNDHHTPQTATQPSHRFLSGSMSAGSGRPQRAPQGPRGSPATALAPTEPYSYGLVASVLRRGSQDDLALCVPGNTTAMNKVAPSSQRPCAPPRIKRHASVVLPRKAGGNKEPIVTVNNASHAELKKWPAKVAHNGPQKMPVFPPSESVPAQNSTSSSHPVSTENAGGHQASVVKTRSSSKRSAASSLSRALGALQLRRTVTLPPSTPDSIVSKPPGSNTPCVPSPGKALSPTLVITPSKPIIPQGIIEEGSKPHVSRTVGMTRSGPGPQVPGSYTPHRHPHPQLLSSSQQLSPLRPPLQPYQHHHPYPLPSPHHGVSHLPHQHPKTYKKQEYL